MQSPGRSPADTVPQAADLNSTGHNQGAAALTNQPKGKLLGIAYDVFMLGCIVLSLLLLALDYLLMGGVGSTLFGLFGWQSALMGYRNSVHGMVLAADQWFTLYLIAEVLLRWALAIVQQRHHRWFFFPFVHWYDVLGCIPQFRALRLLRAVSIGYRLYGMGYRVLPQGVIKQGMVYYKILLEELSDRIVLHVLAGVKQELATDGLPVHLLKPTLDAHRPEIAELIGDIMHSGLAPLLRQYQPAIARKVGAAAADALQHSHEIQQLLRKVPMLGSAIDQQLAVLGHNVGQQITHNLLAPFTAPTLGHDTQQIAQALSKLEFDSPALQRLLNGLVLATVDVVKAQVRKQQWKLKGQQVKEHTV